MFLNSTLSRPPTFIRLKMRLEGLRLSMRIFKNLFQNPVKDKKNLDRLLGFQSVPFIKESFLDTIIATRGNHIRTSLLK